MTNFNLNAFQKKLVNPETYPPVQKLRALDKNSAETNAAYDSAINLIEQTPDLRTLFLQSDHKTRESIGELLAAGILDKTEREDAIARPWAYTTRPDPGTPTPAKNSNPAIKKSRFGQKKPMTSFERSGGFK